MTISPATMTALVLAGFMGAMSVAAAQDVRPRQTAARSGHVKKQARPAAQAKTRQPSDADRWMDRASTSGSGGGGGY